MPDVELVKDGSVGIREKSEVCPNSVAQSAIYLRTVDTDRIDLNTKAADGVIIVLELFQLHAAEWSPVATIKEVEGGIFPYQVRRIEPTVLVIGEDDGNKGLADAHG